MPATDLYHAYGWKARIGLIVPSTNTVNEPEFWRLAPPGVTIHTSRVLLLGQTTAESYIKMGQALDRAAEELATAEVDIIAYGCTSGSIICPSRASGFVVRVRTSLGVASFSLRERESPLRRRVWPPRWVWPACGSIAV